MTEPLTWNSAYRHDEPTPIFDALAAEQERDEAPTITGLSLAEFLKSCWPADRLLQLMMGGFLLLALTCLIAAGLVTK